MHEPLPSRVRFVREGSPFPRTRANAAGSARIAAERTASLSRTFLLIPPLNITLAGPVPLGRMRSFLVPDEPGVYLIHDVRGALYTGRTVSLRRRFGEHCEARGNEMIAHAQRSALGVLAFSWATIPDGQRRAQLEHALVVWLQPPCNRVTPRSTP